MEEKENIMEQPQDEVCSQVAEQNEKEKRVEQTENSGSILGKFKDSENLAKAYESLQKEFTKKCQALASSQRELDSLKSGKQDSETLFLTQNPKAAKYITVLLDMVNSDKLLQDSESPLKSAWDKYRQDNYIEKEDLVKDTEFLDKYVLSNEDIKQKILKEYFENLNLGAVPPMITKQTGSKSILAKRNAPASFVEAGMIAKSIFEKQ